MTYYDLSLFDGLYEIGQPQIQVLVPTERSALIYQYIEDSSVFGHIKQAGQFILFLDPQLLVESWSQLSAFAVDHITATDSASWTKQAQNITELLKIQPQLSYDKVGRPVQSNLAITEIVEPPFKFDQSLWSDPNEPVSQFCRE